MSTDDFKTYLTALEQALKAGNATEHTHRPALKTLLEAIGGPEVQAINEPRQIACGAPDYILTRGVIPLGYVEAKDVGTALGPVENSEQLQRYRQALSNLILTDYFEFRWYLDGELRLTASLPRPGRDGRIRFNDGAASEVAQLLTQFIQADLPLKATPGDLATRMAGLARLIRDLIAQTFKTEDGAGELHAQFNAFREVLLESLTHDQFADMYAQTLAYGLFAARCNAPGQGFTRQNAASNLPKTNPFLRKLFPSIAGPDLDERIAWAVDQLAELLARADIGAALEIFLRRTRREDPVVHFYETFLAAYDPRMREARGVYYTPEPVVGYIVRSIDALLKRDFRLPEGLAHAGQVTVKRPTDKGQESFQTHRVQILDPATGTGTFLYAVIAKIREHFNGNAGAWPGYVAEHLLPRLFGFELLMAPYAVAHMKLGLQLQERGYDFASNQRLGVFLTNSLEQAHEMTGQLPFAQWLAQEADAASRIKRDAPVMVVLGNPPYSGHSVNTGAWIAQLLRGKDGNRKTENYFEVDGQPLGERNPKWLNDDYVKFMRFAQWRIEQTGHGILGFVTNHGYLDNPTFRGMRESLLRGFDEIYVLDLHGNSKKKEKAPDGGKDENVFDIQQGVAIGLFVRREGAARAKNHHARIFHADLYGTRAAKYAGLSGNDVTSTYWHKLAPTSPSYYFVPEDDTLRGEYQRGWKITDAMPVSVLGFQTHRDEFALDFDREKLRERIAAMRDTALTDSEYADRYGVKDNRDWRLRDARNAVSTDQNWLDKLIPVAYRPFDDRWGYFSEVAMDYPRRELIENVVGKTNLCLNITRNTAQREWCHALVSDKPAPAVFVEIKEGSTCIPLWLYPAIDLLGHREKQFNFSASFLSALKARINGRPTSPEDVLGYIYAVLWTPSYRARYADFLRRDFPRIPLTTDLKLFDQLVEAGRELIALHTMASTLPRITGFPVAGSNEVVKVWFTPPPADNANTDGRVWINGAQYFDGVPPAVWEMHVGGYRVAEKWLKDRKGRQLGYDDLTHYQNVIAALARTLALQAGLDEAIAAAGGWPLK